LKILLDHHQLNITLQRLAHELVENHLSFDNTAIIGIQPRGVLLSDRIVQLVRQITGTEHLRYGRLDITFYRDDVHQGNTLHLPEATDIAFSIAGKKVILIDDVLHTGRTIRSAMDALLDFGRPSQIELMVLIDRHFSRELPVQPDYVGRTIDTIMTQKVKVTWGEKEGQNEVLLVG
jgi:pyrimidine operon attenuation protein/uracil phosphoribosyltransferase